MNENQELYEDLKIELAIWTWHLLASSKKYSITTDGTFSSDYFTDCRKIIKQLKKVIPKIPYPIAKLILEKL